ncbi:MAG: hypothetical protein K2N03_01255 [Muribaculaceae bacterium]|nr:hypothetical protein [Muribaculaceae bacterium]
MNRNDFKTSDILTAGVVALGCIIVSIILFHNPTPHSNFGICIPSPSLWNLSPLFSHIANILLLMGVAPILILLNKRFILVQGNGLMLPMAYLILVGANPFISLGFNSSTLLLIVNLISMAVLLSTYQNNNATQDFFLIATLLSVGSMTQYSFVPMILVYIIGGFFLGSMRFKELLAFGMGIIAPYWVAIGLGLIQLSDFRMPQLVNIFTDSDNRLDLLIMMIGTGIVLLVSFLLSLNNAVRLYAGNSRIRKCNNAFNVLGYVCALCMIVDFNNFTAYLASFYLWSAIQFANFFYFNHISRPRLLAWVLCFIYCAQWGLLIFY